MSISAGSIVTADDINTFIDSINVTLSRYGITTISTQPSQGSVVMADIIHQVVTKLRIADQSIYNIRPNQEQSTLVANNVQIGELIEAIKITSLAASATSINNNYCSCNCNYCSCMCDYCSCDYECTNLQQTCWMYGGL